MDTQTSKESQIGFFGAVSIGVGGMVGGGIFVVLGLASVLAGGLEGGYILFFKKGERRISGI